MKHHDSEGIDVGDAIVAGVISDYDRIPRYLYDDETLGIGEFITYAVLLRYAGIGRDSGRGIFPGIELLAELTRSSTASVKRRLVQLVKRGWVSSKRRGLNKTNLYRVHGPHTKYSGVGSGITAENLREYLDAKQTDPSGEIKLIHQEGSEISNQEGSGCATNTKSVEYEEKEHPPKPPMGADGNDFSFHDEEGAPIPVNHGRPRGEGRYQREEEHPYWSGEDGEKQRKRFMSLWNRHPRQEAKDRAMRAWRLNAGDDARHQFGMAVIFKMHGRKCLEWQNFTPGMQPTLEKWIKQRDWLNDDHWPDIAAEITRGEFRSSDDSEVRAYLREPVPVPQIPNRGRPLTQADINSGSRGKFVQ